MKNSALKLNSVQKIAAITMVPLYILVAIGGMVADEEALDSSRPFFLVLGLVAIIGFIVMLGALTSEGKPPQDKPRKAKVQLHVVPTDRHKEPVSKQG